MNKLEKPYLDAYMKHNSLKNKWSTPILTNLVAVSPRNIHKKFETIRCSGLREEVEKVK